MLVLQKLQTGLLTRLPACSPRCHRLGGGVVAGAAQGLKVSLPRVGRGEEGAGGLGRARHLFLVTKLLQN